MGGADIGHFAVIFLTFITYFIQVGSIWISYAIVVGVLFFFALGFVKLYQHRTEKDAFVTTIAVLAITTVPLSVAKELTIGISDDMFVSCRYCVSFEDCRSKYWTEEIMGVT
jgi:hypothetical protein